jgi:hypothetical protein
MVLIRDSQVLNASGLGVFGNKAGRGQRPLLTDEEGGAHEGEGICPWSRRGK